MKKLEHILIAALLLITFSCSKNNDNDSNINDEVNFTISFTDLSHSLKSVNLNDSFPTLDDAKQIVLTIKTINGEDTKYVSEKIEIFKMNGNYFSQKLSLVTGNYKLTEFFLIDSANNTIFATPLIGSQQAQNVDFPLPIEFSIAKDQITSVNVEVLATIGLSPEDFGLVGFIFHEVPTFSFLINVSEKGQIDSLLTAPISITNGTYTYTQTITAIANNAITIRDGYPEYMVSIIKEGYLPFENTFSVDSLKQFAEIPLTIELENEVLETVTDIDGNVYHTVKIGNQVWMVENLKVTKYRNGDLIGTTLADITFETNPKYQWAYNNNSVNVADYGRLYTWYAITDPRKVCPIWWHIPTDSEWNELAINLDQNSDTVGITSIVSPIAGGYLKEAGLDHWSNPNTDATNSTGFNALPGGTRDNHGAFSALGIVCYMWSSTESSTYWANARALSYYSAEFIRTTPTMNYGNSVRCVKD
jgi:uncharacterized protein (TIGR02145 family)